jgi:hypothetical protein
MNLSREAIVKLQREMRDNSADNERTREATGRALRTIGAEIDTRERKIMDARRADLLQLTLAIESLAARVVLLERPWHVKLRAWVRAAVPTRPEGDW